MKTIDSIRPPASRRRPPKRTEGPRATGARFTKLQTAKRRRRVAWGLIAAVAASPLLIGLAIFKFVGLAVLVFAGVVFVVLRVPSRVAFALALMALFYMVGARLAGATEVAGALAAQVYVLLAIGVFLLAREVKSANRLWFKKH